MSAFSCRGKRPQASGQLLGICIACTRYSGRDIDACHYRLGAVTGAANAGTASGRQMVAASPAAVGAAPHSVGQRTEGGAV